MRLIPIVAVSTLLSACGSIHMPAPVAYSGACPKEDYKCQRNLDAQTLSYIGEKEAAVRLMCEEPKLRNIMGSKCANLLQQSDFALY
jgi:hypothetical protein